MEISWFYRQTRRFGFVEEFYELKIQMIIIRLLLFETRHSHQIGRILFRRWKMIDLFQNVWNNPLKSTDQKAILNSNNLQCPLYFSYCTILSQRVFLGERGYFYICFWDTVQSKLWWKRVKTIDVETCLLSHSKLPVTLASTIFHLLIKEPPLFPPPQK